MAQNHTSLLASESGVLSGINTGWLGTFRTKFQTAFPTRALFLLLLVAVLDLISTSWLYQQGLISERNPLMRVFIDRSNFLFILVKGSTILVAWYFLANYAKTHRYFVRNACLIATTIYVSIWVIGVLA